MGRELSFFSQLTSSLCGGDIILPEHNVTDIQLAQASLQTRQLIVVRMGSFCNGHKARKYIMRVAAGIVALMDALDDVPAACPAGVLIHQTGKALEMLLDFILKYYGRDFDMELDLPKRRISDNVSQC